MASTSKAQERPTSLKGKKDSFEFEIWVEIDGKPLEAYGVTEGEDGVPEAWIASEAGKAYAVAVRMKNTDFKPSRSPYPDLHVQCDIDGGAIRRTSYRGHELLKANGCTTPAAERRILENQVQKLVFAQPVLTEDDTPGLNMDKLASIEVVFKRCKKPAHERPAKGFSTIGSSTVKVNEQTKKGALLASVTAFGEPEVRKLRPRVKAPVFNPQDARQGYFTMRLRYAPRDYLQAQGLVPLDINIKPGEDGLQKHQPICVDDDDQPQAGPPTSRTKGVKAEKGVKVKAEGALSGEDDVLLIARQIAEAQAELEALQARQRESLAAKQSRSRTDDNEDDKENIMRGMREGMNKKLKVAKVDDGGIVDLTFDDD